MPFRPLATLLLAAAALTSAPAWAATPQELAEQYFYATSANERETARAELADIDSADATYALGAIEFFTAVETLAGDLNRHGVTSPVPDMLPVLNAIPPLERPADFPVEPIDYETFRGILARFRDGLDGAATTLSRVPPDAGVTLTVDLDRMTLNPFGPEVFASQYPAGPLLMAAMRPRRDEPEQAMTFHFDRADAYWLQGYSNVIAGNIDFLLAHDFSLMFEESFTMFFPGAAPSAEHMVPRATSRQGMQAGRMAREMWQVADVINLVHRMDLEVVDAGLRKRARERLLEMIRLSELSWQAIEAETDDEGEWLPGPHQAGINPLAGVEVTGEQVAAWRQTLATFKALLEGDLLVPHWRFPERGINLESLFESEENFDLVSLLTGAGALPYLEEGEVMDAEAFNRSTRAFGPLGFLGTAIWFN